MEPLTRRMALHFYTDLVDECLDFYSRLLSFTIVKDLEMANGRRWATVAKSDNLGIQLHFHPIKPDLDRAVHQSKSNSATPIHGPCVITCPQMASRSRNGNFHTLGESNALTRLEIESRYRFGGTKNTTWTMGTKIMSLARATPDNAPL